MKRYITPLILSALIAGCATSDQNASNFEETKAQLAGYYWQLKEATNASGDSITALFVRPQKPIQIEFTDGDRFNVKNLCNTMTGLYTINEVSITFGQAASTKMLCGDPKVDVLDKELGTRLLNSNTYQVGMPTDHHPATLQLKTPSNDVLTFIGIPTPDTRFQKKGDTLFIEIAPQWAPSESANTLVPQIRQVFYDDQGLRTGADPWHALTQPIEGFTPQEGAHHVLRIKRYMTQDRPVLILDQIIEAHVVPAKTLTKRPIDKTSPVKAKRTPKR